MARFDLGGTCVPLWLCSNLLANNLARIIRQGTMILGGNNSNHSFIPSTKDPLICSADECGEIVQAHHAW